MSGGVLLMSRTKQLRPGTAPPAKFIAAKSELNDTIARFDFSTRDPRATDRSVSLAGTTDRCRERFRLRPGTTTVGRSEADIQLHGSEVSRLHATIKLTDDEILLKDQGSSNGTFVNREQVQTAALRDGDIIIFGIGFRFVVVVEEPLDQVVKTAPDALAELEPVPGDTLETLKRDRRELATLFQIAMRYLGQRSPSDCLDVLFEVLPRVVRFEVAFVAVNHQGSLEFHSHPASASLSPNEYRALAAEGAGGPAVFDSGDDELNLSVLRARSRVVIPLADGGCVGLLCEELHEYAERLDFLAILGQLHSAAVAAALR